MLNWVKTRRNFILTSFIAQSIGGIGSGMTSTANLAIISSFSSLERERFFGYLEASNGIGLLFGPLIGAILYSIGGFSLPFFFFSCLQIMAFPFVGVYFVKAAREADEAVRNSDQLEEYGSPMRQVKEI